MENHEVKLKNGLIILITCRTLTDYSEVHDVKLLKPVLGSGYETLLTNMDCITFDEALEKAHKLEKALIEFHNL